MESLLPLLLIFAVMMLPLMFLSSRQKKAQQKQRALVDQLGVGDEVRTHSGFYGLIVDSFDDVVVLESEDGSQSKWARQAIAMGVDPVESDETSETQDEAAEETSGTNDIPGVTVTDDSERSEERRER